MYNVQGIVLVSFPVFDGAEAGLPCLDFVAWDIPCLDLRPVLRGDLLLVLRENLMRNGRLRRGCIVALLVMVVVMMAPATAALPAHGLRGRRLGG